MTKLSGNMGLLVIAFVAILVGVIFLGVVMDNVTETTTSYGEVNNELINTGLHLGDTEFTVTNKYVKSVLWMTNQSNSTLEADTDYLAYLNNTYQNNIFLTTTGNNTNGSTEHYIAYTFDQANYIRNAPSRTLISLLGLFFALGILFAAWFYLSKTFEWMRFWE